MTNQWISVLLAHARSAMINHHTSSKVTGHPPYACTSDLHWEQIRPAQFRSSPAGFFSALGPLRQQHHTQLCQLQCSDPQQPHSSPRVPADIYSRLYSLTDAFSGISRSKSVSFLNTDANLPPILQHAEFVRGAAHSYGQTPLEWLLPRSAHRRGVACSPCRKLDLRVCHSVCSHYSESRR